MKNKTSVISKRVMEYVKDKCSTFSICATVQYAISCLFPNYECIKWGCYLIIMIVKTDVCRI